MPRKHTERIPLTLHSEGNRRRKIPKREIVPPFSRRIDTLARIQQQRPKLDT
jgi:hypothetical protein